MPKPLLNDGSADMATNSLAPKPVNAMARQSDPLQSLLVKSSEYPQYGQLVDYLSSRRMMPPIQFAPETQGRFSQNTVFGFSLPKTGLVEVGANADPGTVVHELTHAADSQFNSQYYGLKRKNPSNLSPLEKQFVDGYEKLVYGANVRTGNPEKYPRERMAATMSPEWAKENAGYRAGNRELPAWAMGSVVEPLNSQQYRTPLHLDPTLASEFSILLDLATRLQKSNPATEKR